jgi:hypothetical protein
LGFTALDKVKTPNGRDARREWIDERSAQQRGLAKEGREHRPPIMMTSRRKWPRLKFIPLSQIRFLFYASNCLVLQMQPANYSRNSDN